jgi:hypothetical protein
MREVILHYSFLLICLSVVLLQAIHPFWKEHLVFDVYTYFERSQFFINNFNFSGVLNEYHPGAIIFFILLSPFMLIDNSLDTYIRNFLIINTFLAILLAFLIHKFTNSKNILLYAILILFTGPIIFYRFELLVVLLTISAIYFLSKNSYLSNLFLAAAVLTKLYPIVYLPLFIFSWFKEKNMKSTIRSLGIFFFFFIIVLTCYFFSLRIGIEEFIFSLNYHAAKPIGIEGFWTSLITSFKLISDGIPPALTSGNKTWGISPDNLILPAWFINNFWIIAIEVVYLVIILKKYKVIEAMLLITLTLLVFSKLSAPQYLTWFLFLLPLINFEKYLQNVRYTYILLTSLLIAFLSQYIYPLNYNSYLQFFIDQSKPYLFYINLFRNILILSLFYPLITLHEKN